MNKRKISFPLQIGMALVLLQYFFTEILTSLLFFLRDRCKG